MERFGTPCTHSSASASINGFVHHHPDAKIVKELTIDTCYALIVVFGRVRCAYETYLEASCSFMIIPTMTTVVLFPSFINNFHLYKVPHLLAKS